MEEGVLMCGVEGRETHFLSSARRGRCSRIASGEQSAARMTISACPRFRALVASLAPLGFSSSAGRRGAGAGKVGDDKGKVCAPGWKLLMLPCVCGRGEEEWMYVEREDIGYERSLTFLSWW